MDGGLQWKTLLKWMIWGENPLFSETSMIRDDNDVEFTEVITRGAHHHCFRGEDRCVLISELWSERSNKKIIQINLLVFFSLSKLTIFR